MPTNSRLARVTGAFVLFFLLFAVGGLIPGPLRAAIESCLGLPFSVPPVAHFALFVAMAFCLSWASPRLGVIGTLAIMLVLGAVVELLQEWIPGRTPSWEDFLLDTLGAGLGCLACLLVKRSCEKAAVSFNKEN
ncbi:VanZ family protein [Halomonas sp. McH1-25]|uniref:VanZ family protein n=1 Tax=unclassified Halomonas TaxID=2609666 RepID=UPI001EF6B8E4|nr:MULTISPECIES: VanZ family protein [unclassified Halomonas]MCG7601025.1 VanZ family protein [Halomonas sp. McH1-25]MCP1342116.1 VanZ family protein [Halomonas sp. FL8]MCP1360595.1 VanZ family protein [Halomonas sp. BBD45]